MPFFTKEPHLSDLIESPKQFVEGLDEIRSAETFRQRREVNDVRVQYADVVVPLDVHLVKAGLLAAVSTRVRHLEHY